MEVGSPAGHRSENFSRNFLPSRAFLMSWNSSGVVRLPFLFLVVGLELDASPFYFGGIYLVGGCVKDIIRVYKD